MTPSNRLPVTVLIMAQNEEENIAHAVGSVIEHFDQVIVVDSFSEDRTAEICKGYDNLEFYEHEFEGWAEQRNWMLANCAIRHGIVFFLDADECVDEDFRRELAEIVSGSSMPASLSVNIRYIFLGRVLRYAYRHRPVQRIFRRDGLIFSGEGAREYAHSDGENRLMNSRLTHHDRKPIADWIAKHNRNSDREAAFFMKAMAQVKEQQLSPGGGVLLSVRARLWIRQRLWNSLPLFYRSILYFLYRYVLLGGFLEGRPGAIYCFLHSMWYMSLVDIKILEKQIAGDAG